MIGLNFFKKVLSWLSAGDSAINYIGSQLGKQSNNELMNGLSSLFNSLTGSHLTGAQQESNQFSAEEAEKERQWQEHMRATNFQTQVADMQAAGLNPALMYQNGGSSGTPSGASASSVAPSGPATLQEIVALMKMKKEMAILDAQRDNIVGDTRVKAATVQNLDANTAATHQNILKLAEETGLIKLQKEWYPSLTDAQVRKINSEIDKLVAELGLVDAQTSEAQAHAGALNAQKLLTDKQSKWYDEYTQAEIDKMLSERDVNRVEKLIRDFRVVYMENYGTDVPASGWATLLAHLGYVGYNTFGVAVETLSQALKEVLKEAAPKIEINQSQFKNPDPLYIPDYSGHK